MTTDQIHAAGVERHGSQWFHANQRAVEEVWGSQILMQHMDEVKRVMPRIILRILDIDRLKFGYKWNAANKSWEGKSSI